MLSEYNKKFLTWQRMQMQTAYWRKLNDVHYLFVDRSHWMQLTRCVL